MAKLTLEQIVTIEVLLDKGQSASEVARLLGVTEGAVRYHRRRASQEASDGRKKAPLVEALGLVGAIDAWWKAQVAVLGPDRPPNVEALHQRLVADYGYEGSYKSIRKFVRSRFGAPPRRPFRRFESPPGAQAQSDWGEFRSIDVGGPEGPTTLYAFVMVLSHSRMEAVVWSPRMDQLAWHHVHNEAFTRLGGVPAVNRIDNLKTGIARGAGWSGEINEQYRTYARSLGFHIDACEPGAPQQKGKVERRVGALGRWSVPSLRFEGVAGLQSWTDEQLTRDAARRTCPATGKSVLESWEAERPKLRALPPRLPEPFDMVRQAPVHKDCTVRFEGRSYAVPFVYVGGAVEVRGCSGKVQVLDTRTGQVLVEYPRGTAERVLIDPACYEGPGTKEVLAPPPLGRMGRRAQEIAAMEVEERPIDLYAAFAEVAR